ncbi:MAG: hypothetical protein PHT33_09810 [bacterium]|nr:hypothetical protein [bacterium]
MPTSLADYGVTVFAIGAVIWMVSNVLTTVLGKKQNGRGDGDNQLLQQVVTNNQQVITNNTQALTRLIDTIQENSNTLNRHTEHIDYLRIEVAKNKRGGG